MLHDADVVASQQMLGKTEENYVTPTPGQPLLRGGQILTTDLPHNKQES